jgi:hypothetical protein
MEPDDWGSADTLFCVRKILLGTDFLELAID